MKVVLWLESRRKIRAQSYAEAYGKLKRGESLHVIDGARWGVASIRYTANSAFDLFDQLWGKYRRLRYLFRIMFPQCWRSRKFGFTAAYLHNVPGWKDYGWVFQIDPKRLRDPEYVEEMAAFVWDRALKLVGQNAIQTRE